MAHPYWPLFDLEVRTPRLTLRYIDDELGLALVELALGGVHDPDFMPFAMPWTDVEPEVLGRNSFQYWWRCRADITVDSWDINLAVIEDGQVVGATGLGAKDFPVTTLVRDRFVVGSPSTRAAGSVPSCGSPRCSSGSSDWMATSPAPGRSPTTARRSGSPANSATSRTASIDSPAEASRANCTGTG